MFKGHFFFPPRKVTVESLPLRKAMWKLHPELAHTAYASSCIVLSLRVPICKMGILIPYKVTIRTEWVGTHESCGIAAGTQQALNRYNCSSQLWSGQKEKPFPPSILLHSRVSSSGKGLLWAQLYTGQVDLSVSMRNPTSPLILFITQHWTCTREARGNLEDYPFLAYQEYHFSFLNFNL